MLTPFSITAILCLFIALFLLNPVASAQEEYPCDLIPNKKAVKIFEDALKTLKYDKETGHKLLLEAVEKDKNYIEAYYVLADFNMKKAESLKKMADNTTIHEMLSCFTRAEKYYTTITELCPSFDNFSAYYTLGNYYYNIENNCGKAQKHLAEFINNTNETNPLYKKAKDMHKNCEELDYLLNHPVPFDPQPVKGICTESDEYLPLVSPDGTLAFYTHRFSKLNKIMNYGSYIEEFTVSEKTEETKDGTEIFQKGTPMPPPFNEGKNQGGVAISIDNNHIFITICEMTQAKNQPYNNCDIYVTDYVNGKWTPLRNLGPNVNGHDTWESQPSISSDGKTLYFASIRKGNFGFNEDNPTCDIWKSEMSIDEKWTKAANLGPKINTAGNEKSPFIHTDSQTLYFSSNGLFGLGGYDIFYSKLQENKTWTDPKNIGYPINTEGDDIGFIVSTDGRKAYFSSNRLKGKGGWDIFSFDLYNEARPEKVMLVTGYLKDEKGDELKDANVELKNTKTNKVSEAMVDKISGKYAIAITVDTKRKDEFLMVVKKDGYAFTSEYIKPFEDEKFEKPAKVDFEVKPVKVGETIKLNNIQFAYSSSSFDDASRIVLNNFAEFLEENPTIKIAIYGHTDNTGTPKRNKSLSEERAKAVFDYLLISGIDAKRMKYKGFGQTKPLATNETPEGRALNRRTEFVITSK